MPVTVVVGGQFGSEGKGKVVAHFAQSMGAAAVVRCGGSNSGHTVYNDLGERFVLRHLPTACISSSAISVIAAGSYIDVDVVLREVSETGISPESLCIDPNAVVITEKHKQQEALGGLVEAIGSTASGTGQAVCQRLARFGSITFAKNAPELYDYICDTKSLCRKLLQDSARILIEGTQGYGLSVVHSPYYPYVTSRDTTAAGFISECGVSPLDVDDIILVIRAFPIRVAGDSGPLPNEIEWATVAQEGGTDICAERTSVTNRVRRVARFDPAIVREAVQVNRPTRIVLNHLDYVPTEHWEEFVTRIEKQIGTSIDYVGTSPETTERWPNAAALCVA